MPGLLNQSVPIQSLLGTGLTIGGQGLAPYGQRHTGEGVKGLGFFGAVPHSDGGYSTEISSEFDHNGKTVEHPLMVPTLTAEQIKHLLSGAEPTEEIYQAAQDHALSRMQQGQSPFFSGGLRYPLPQGF